MIEVEHLTKYYGASAALKDVTFSVQRGEILGFLGPNGAGKTTTMRCITGYLPPTSGTVRVAGFDVAEKSVEARKHLGYLPETVPLYTDLTTYEYLDFRARLCGLTSGRERKQRIFEVMDQLNIGDVSGKLVGKLSRGYRQRVGLAQAILHNPDALILDEPTVGLDPVQITEVRSLIKDLGRNHTVILSTHLLPEVSMVCDRVIIINRGRLVALDTPINLAEGVAEGHALLVEVRGAPAEVQNAIRSVSGVSSVSIDGAQGALTAQNQDGAYTYRVESVEGVDLRPGLAASIVGAGFDLLELKSYKLSLEDVFLRVIAREAEEQDEDEQYVDAYSEDIENGGDVTEGAALGGDMNMPESADVAHAESRKVVAARRPKR